MGDHFAALDPFDHAYAFGEKLLVLKSWMFNTERHQDIIQMRYPIKPDTANAEVDGQES